MALTLWFFRPMMAPTAAEPAANWAPPEAAANPAARQFVTLSVLMIGLKGLFTSDSWKLSSIGIRLPGVGGSL
jgi:hypothetical protein